jgi:hypothetical protein
MPRIYSGLNSHHPGPTPPALTDASRTNASALHRALLYAIHLSFVGTQQP